MSEPDGTDQPYAEMFAERSLTDEEVASIDELVVGYEAGPSDEESDDGGVATPSPTGSGSNWSQVFAEAPAPTADELAGIEQATTGPVRRGKFAPQCHECGQLGLEFDDEGGAQAGAREHAISHAPRWTIIET